ncbi:MAG: PEGA domain-containing protein [Spirochaetales bacterium]|nr:PEGA domain-containing protein [Spirochaetales bacterium]
MKSIFSAFCLLVGLGTAQLFAQAGALAPSPYGGASGGPFVVHFTSNVNSAPVYIDGNYVNTTDFSMRLSAGSHLVRATAPGYADWINSIYVNGNMTVPIIFQSVGAQQPIAPPAPPPMFRLRIGANVNGVQIFIDGRPVEGESPDGVMLSPGRHRIRVFKNGYQEWQRDVDVDRDWSLRADLRPEHATLEIVLSDANRNPYVGDANRRIECFVDGQIVPRHEGNRFQIAPGLHTIRIVSGGLSVERRWELRPGRSYRIEPVLNLNIRE